MSTGASAVVSVNAGGVSAAGSAGSSELSGCMASEGVAGLRAAVQAIEEHDSGMYDGVDGTADADNDGRA